VTNTDTTYTFNVDVTDSENQSTTRQFSVTYRVDVVTWSSPADGASFSWTQGQSNSAALTAASAAGKSVSFAVQSGSLLSNVTISGNLITGIPDTVQSNTAVTIRATAADTLRYADRTLYFTVAAAGPSVIGEAYGGGYYAGQWSATADGVATHYLIVAPKDTGQTSTNWSGAVSFCDGLTIGGYTDWVLPSKNQLEILYYNLKPTTSSNDTSSGINPNAVPARASNYTTSVPAQTSAIAFRSGNAEEIGTYCWSSTEQDGNTANAWKQVFTNGQQFADKKSDPGTARAIRLIPI
jgi:hypothetical protein